MEAWELNDLRAANAEPWMIHLMECNRGYQTWSPGDDGMRGHTSYETWDDFIEEYIKLDDYNECVNFHFEVYRASDICTSCDGRGCGRCNGSGEVFTEDKAHVELNLWMIKPRKGSSHGVTVERIKPADLAKVQAFLVTARERNHERFDGALDIAAE